MVVAGFVVVRVNVNLRISEALLSFRQNHLPLSLTPGIHANQLSLHFHRCQTVAKSRQNWAFWVVIRSG